MKKMFMAVIALMMTISASAQFYIYCSDGNVIKVDSISMIAPGEPEQPNPSAGIGVFSVSADKQVTFSKGNLQYHPANDEWRFAENQTDYIGDANSNISSTYNGWLDLFGWSGDTGAAKFGINTSTYDSDYSGKFVDWGVNQIGNESPNTWRTLTYDEWNYLLYNRTYADSLIGVAQINGINGIILLPDNWSGSNPITFKAGFYNSSTYSDFDKKQIYTLQQWKILESFGAIFLPVTGYRYKGYKWDHGAWGYYWCASPVDDVRAYRFRFLVSGMEMYSIMRHYGLSVRLVKDL